MFNIGEVMKRNIICFGKEYKSKKELADNYGITDKTLYSRLNRGYTVEEAVTLTKEEARQHSLENFSSCNKPLEESEVRKRMKKYGYDIID